MNSTNTEEQECSGNIHYTEIAHSSENINYTEIAGATFESKKENITNFIEFKLDSKDETSEAVKEN